MSDANITPSLYKKKDNSFLGRVRKDFARNKVLYLIALLPVIYYILFHYKPMYGLIIAFKDYIPALGIMDSDWADAFGFGNFIRFFENRYFTRLLGNTLRISVTALLVGFPMPIVLALLLNELTNKYFIKTVQTVTYLPHFISVVVMCGMIKSFTGSTGIITQFLANFNGGDTTSILLKPEWFTGIYVGTNIWQECGWGSIIYLAALSGIDQSLYEACEIDGGGRLRQAWHITLPGIAPTIIILLIMRMGQVLSVGYEKVILLYNEHTYKTADVILSYVYREGLINANYSYSTAVGLFNSLVNILLLCVANTISKKVSETSLW